MAVELHFTPDSRSLTLLHATSYLMWDSKRSDSLQEYICWTGRKAAVVPTQAVLWILLNLVLLYLLLNADHRTIEPYIRLGQTMALYIKRTTLNRRSNWLPPISNWIILALSVSIIQCERYPFNPMLIRSSLMSFVLTLLGVPSISRKAARLYDSSC